MMPYIEIGELKIASYGLMAVVGMVVALWTAVYYGRKYGIITRDVLCASCYGALGMVVGAKLFYGIPFVPEMIRNLVETGSICGGETMVQFLSRVFAGYVFYGGFLGMMAGVVFYANVMKMPVGNFLNVLAIAVPLFHGFGRIGCYLAGCCYGGYFPVQLLESACNFALFAVLVIYGKKIDRPAGLMAVYLLVYPIIRFVMEFFRADEIRGVLHLGGLSVSTSQIVSVMLFVWGICLRKGKSE